jgi:thiol-disulfide isomerase/thioredoxin
MLKTTGIARPLGLAALAALLAATGVARARQADAPKGKAAGPETLEAIDAEFGRGLTDLQRQRLRRLARLAASQQGAESQATYDAFFRAAISTGLFDEAEAAAERVLKSGATSPGVGFLAALTNMIAEADRGAYQESLDSLVAAIHARDRAKAVGADAAEAAPLPVATRASLIEAYFQKLVQSGQFEVARKAMALIRDKTDSTVIQGIAANRLQRLDLVGKAAPALAGTDIDGKPFRLADLKGDVVLVHFWASWCVPSSAEIAWFESVYDAQRAKGFRVVGVNLDAAGEGGPSVETVLPNIRRFLLDHNVRWPNLINGPGDRDHAAAFGVAEIPANVLVGRDGKVIHLDLTRSNLEKVVAEAVGK